MKLLIRKMKGWSSRIKNPDYSSCGHCGRTWDTCKYHATPYTNNSAGCFPLCEDCWSELSIEERLPHYMRLVDSWEAFGYPPNYHETWDELRLDIKESVLSGE